MLFPSSLMTPIEVNISFTKEKEGAPRKTIPNPRFSSSTQGIPEDLFVFEREETVSGDVTLTPKKGKKFDHTGISISVVCVLESPSGMMSSQKILGSEQKEFGTPGSISEETSYHFDFSSVKKEYESYYGENMNVRYFVRVSIKRKLMPITNRDADFFVIDYGKAAFKLPEKKNKSISMDVGIKDCLAIRLDIEHSVFHLNDVILGTILFDLVRIRMKRMELSIIKRETYGKEFFEEKLETFEIMDGSPIKKEVVPVRMYLANYDLTPTYKTIDGVGSVRYFLDLGLYDEDERRYFKQHEIYLWRDRDENMLDKNKTNFIAPYFEKLREDLRREEEEAIKREERRRKRREEREQREKEKQEKEKMEGDENNTINNNNNDNNEIKKEEKKEDEEVKKVGGEVKKVDEEVPKIVEEKEKKIEDEDPLFGL